MTENKNYTEGQPIEPSEKTRIYVHKDVLMHLKLYEDIGTISQLRALKEERDKYFLEIQQYRAIGTVEEIQKKMEELERWHTIEVNPKIKNVFANTSTLICYNCVHKDEYIEELESEIEEYQAIGTIDEFKALKEKATPKKVAYQGEHEKCPICGSFHVFGNYCTECGQELDLEKENKQ